VIAADVLVFDSSFWNALWVILIVIPIITFWVLALVDVIWRGDLSAGRKVLWLLLIFVLPVIGVLAYLVTRPRRAESMSYEAVQWEQASTKEQVRSLDALHAAGKLTDAELAAAKAKVTTEGT
jgi:hypothetical protein